MQTMSVSQLRKTKILLIVFMKRFTFLTLLFVSALVLQSTAKNGYKISVKFTDMKDTLVYLAHYYGKPMPTIYKTDSAHFDKNGVAVLQSKQKTLGGIYIILLSDKKTFFEFLLNNGDEMNITATAKELPDGVVFKGSPENDHFLEYVKFLKGFGAEQQGYQTEMASAKSAADTAAIRKKMTSKGKTLVSFRREYVKKYPGTLLSSIFNALEMPEVPE